METKLENRRQLDEKSIPNLGKLVHSSDDIQSRVKELADQITQDFSGKVPIFITVLTGAAYFVTDLTRSVGISHEMDFLALTVEEDSSAGLVDARIIKDVQLSITGRDIIIACSVVDTGLTLAFVRKVLETHDPASISVATLLDRPSRRVKDDLSPNYVGFETGDKFLAGYGFDYKGYYRELTDIHELDISPQDHQTLLGW